MKNKILEGLRRIILESTDEELDDALRHAGIDPAELARRGREACKRAICHMEDKHRFEQS